MFLYFIKEVTVPFSSKGLKNTKLKRQCLSPMMEKGTAPMILLYPCILSFTE